MMKRLATLMALAGCATEPRPVAEPLPRCDTVVLDAGPDAPEIAWGFADLHAHPAIERSFGETGLVWGTARTPGVPNANELPPPTPCPGETHATQSGGPLERTAHTLILPLINQQEFYPHPLIATPDGRVDTEGWPNGRDVLHQQMQLSSIRRAYEGGLRLMLASVTDNQTLSGLVRGPHLADGVHPNRAEELASARRQLDAIEVMAAEQSSWMSIARSPGDARAIIRSGRLALVLSLEMDGLTLANVQELHRDYSVGHVIPVHLVDNDVGGSAAFSSIFNAASAIESEMFGLGTLRYLQVENTVAYRRSLEWPIHIGSMDIPLLFEPEPIGYDWFAGLGYEHLCWCDAGSVRGAAFRRLGHRNSEGIRDGVGENFIRGVMDLGLLLDVSHMSWRAVEETLALAESDDYPVIASHGGVGPSGEGRIESERSLTHAHAVRVASSGGVLGLGTSGHYETLPLLVARGGPVLALALARQGVTSACVGEAECTPPRARATLPEPATASLEGQVLRVALTGSFPAAGDSSPFLRVDIGSPSADASPDAPGVILYAPLSCSRGSCLGEITIPTEIPPLLPDGRDPISASCASDSPEAAQFPVSALESVAIGWVRTGVGDARCRVSLTGATEASIQTYRIELGGSVVAAGEGVPLATLNRDRGQWSLFERSDQEPSRTAPTDWTSLVRVSLRSAPGSSNALAGAASGRLGAEVCVRVRTAESGACPGVATLPAMRGCGEGWASVNHRGTWAASARFDTFVRVPESARVCALDIAVINPERAGAWALDEVRVERITDPAAEWNREYLRTLGDVFGGEAGRVALGSDLNGLQVQMPITDRGVTGASYEAWGCHVPPLAPLRVAGSSRTVTLDQNGLGTYGLLADLVALTGELDPPTCDSATSARRSLFLSAEATLRAWERARNERPRVAENVQELPSVATAACASPSP